MDTSGLRQRRDELKRRADDRAARLLEVAGERTVQFLRSLTTQISEDGRRLHPGQWADRTGETVSSFSFEVTRGRSGLRLTILNDSSAAVELEEMDGIFVVSGVADPGGPIEDALVDVVGRVAPGLEVRRRGR